MTGNAQVLHLQLISGQEDGVKRLLCVDQTQAAPTLANRPYRPKTFSTASYGAKRRVDKHRMTRFVILRHLA